MRRLIGAVSLLVAGTLAGACTSGSSGTDPAATHPASSASSASSASRAVARSSPPTGSTTARPGAPASTTSTPATTSATLPTLPRGGRAIIGHYRVVAYYGAAGAPALGVLGTGSPEHEAQSVITRAKQWAGFGLPVQPAMELIATVAQASPGPDGDYSAPVSHATIRRYLAVAHAHKMLLVLDLQPGRASFLSQAKGLGSLLADPSVSLALDPEWKVQAPQTPGGGLIGSSRAGDINATARYVAGIVKAHHLPDKLLVVHEFTLTMLPDREKIIRAPGVETTFHADGFGSKASKTGVFRGLHFPGHPFGTGFKLFLTQDRGKLMSPKSVMALKPRPDVITYQ